MKPNLAKRAFNKLKREVSRDLVAEIDALKEEIAALKSAGSVGFVDWGGPIKVFMYTDDRGYHNVKPTCRFDNTTKEQLTARPIPKRNAAEAYKAPETRTLLRVLCHYWLNDLEFAFIDVGAQYGSSAIDVAMFIDSCGKSNKVICFEPGIARNLVPFNLAASHMENRIVFEPMAVTDSTRPVILFGERGKSANNRIVNRDLNSEGHSYLIQGVSIDDYVAKSGICENIILKIDTQGGEVEVLAGMAGAMRERVTSFIAEFTPHALRTRVDPAAWLSDFAAEYYLLDVPDAHGPTDQTYRMIEASDCATFAAEVDQRPSQYTDILFLPKNLPNVDSLLEVMGS